MSAASEGHPTITEVSWSNARRHVDTALSSGGEWQIVFHFSFWLPSGVRVDIDCVAVLKGVLLTQIFGVKFVCCGTTMCGTRSW